MRGNLVTEVGRRAVIWGPDLDPESSFNFLKSIAVEG